MSARKLQIEFSIRAQKDVDDILAYTLEIWGNKQLTSYRSKIDRVLKNISRAPAKGLKHDAVL